MVRSFQNLHGVQTGFGSEGVLTFRLRAPMGSYPTVGEKVAFYEEVMDAVRAVPGVETVGVGKIGDIFCERGIEVLQDTMRTGSPDERATAAMRERRMAQRSPPTRLTKISSIRAIRGS